MITPSSSRLFRQLLQCNVYRALPPSNNMTKRAQHRPPIKKLKCSPSGQMTNTHEQTSPTTQANLPIADGDTTSDNSPRRPAPGIVYLDTPTKSENDKKLYRTIQLENGLIALLITDVVTKDGNAKMNEDDSGSEVDRASSAGNESTDEETDDEGDEDDTEDDDDDDDDEDDSQTDGASDDDDSNGTRKKLKRDGKMAACGLSVDVGSFSDPPDIPGLAHFLEHMVFMGSEKYPLENDFDMFIKKHGGSENASTECEMTTFYFEIQEKHLLPALDQFAQFFIHPLMKRDAIARERESVESEFQMALPSDYYRREQLICSLAKTDHPATKFTWGNLITLRDNVPDEVLYQALHKFKERHYSAHRMKLAIQARLPLDVLEDYVIQCFSSVPKNDLPAYDFDEFKGADSFDTPRFRRMYKVKPVRDVCQVDLTWSMPPMLHMYRKKPEQYLSYILGHEGKGTLISYLRRKMWCLDVCAGVGDDGSGFNSMYSLFSMSLVMTDEGHKHLEDVLNAVFGYINLLAKEGPQKHLFEEIQKTADISFTFTDEVPPAEYVEELAENMHLYPPKDYITGSELYYEYDPEAIQEYLKFLSPTNMNIVISDKLFKDEEFDKVEPWFQTKYTDVEIPPDWIERWKTIEPLPEFHLPLPNIYLADDFTLISLPENVPKYPTKIHFDNVCEIWYRPDPKFRLPECYMYFYFISPMPLHSPERAGMMDLYVSILKQLLIEELYPASAIGLIHQVYTSDKGIILKLSGLNQKLPMLLTTIVKYIADSANLITEDLFKIMKKEQIKEYYNTFLKPRKLAKDVRLAILKQIHWTAVDRHSAIGNVKFPEFLEFAKTFTNHIYVQSLIQGNMSSEHAIEHVSNALKILKCGALEAGTAPELRIMEIPKGVTYCKLENYNKTDVNSVVTNYYQADTAYARLSVLIELIVMIMEEPLFNQLRTLEQLGYNVSCLMRDTFGVIGYSITVCTQADKHSTEHVDQRIESFLKRFKVCLDKMTEDDLASVKEALIKIKQCADIDLKEEVNTNWMEITTSEYMFNRIERDLLLIEAITLDELRVWMAKHTIGGGNFRKLSVQIIGKAPDKKRQANVSQNGENEVEIDGTSDTVKYPLRYVTKKKAKNDPARYINNIEDFKRDLGVFPVYAPVAL